MKTFKNSDYVVQYLTECTLATVIHLHYLKSKSKHEYGRQIAIAQTGIDYLKCMSIMLEGRVADVINNNNSDVKQWLATKTVDK